MYADNMVLGIIDAYMCAYIHIMGKCVGCSEANVYIGGYMNLCMCKQRDVYIILAVDVM